MAKTPARDVVGTLCVDGNFLEAAPHDPLFEVESQDSRKLLFLWVPFPLFNDPTPCFYQIT